MGRLTTHVLDTASGKPAQSMKLSLFALEKGQRKLLKETATNSDGRCDAPLLESDNFKVGQYEIVFDVGAYFSKRGELPSPNFLNDVPIRFAIADASAHYHVPLLVSPWAYSTYRGS